MEDNNFRGNNNNKAPLVSSLPIFIFFIIMSIHTIVTKNNLIAISLSICSLIIFTSLTTLLLYTYIMHNKQLKDHK
ncbi:hypothetical protein ISO99_07230 [Staphylococcus sp. 18_1_E_LY]|uniref:Uncharacterized protein n=1 Tax=Staphylococcus lloydii TaxID=2781774 RepID=A0A7T1F9B1_9STAP|nr:hypothetical protein [Staphylococcus lloydii]MBF7019705.1 hypothetical protein [Staphylococcus lloydii]MBF7027433.1 hypothetical protein [Staphylococcus lloydii]QPM75092.1 hypothetical protein ISP08_12360 [Staphylococcus lloydii]